MSRTLGRRVLAGLAAATAACAFAAPASAAAAATVKIAITPATVAAGGSALVTPILYASDDITAREWTLTYELSGGLAGVTLHSPEAGLGCTEVSPTKVTCSDEWPMELGPGGYAPSGIQLDATKAALGESGKVTATFTAAGLTTVTRSTKVTVAEGVDLAAGPDKEITAKPGATFTAALQVHNTTDAVVHGAALVFGTDYGFSAPPASRFANCFYAGDELNACTFDEELRPGVTYQLELPYQLRPATYAPSTQDGQFQWLTAGDYEDLLAFIDDNGFEGPGKAGSGAALKLQALPAASSLTPQKQTDVNPDNNWQNLTVKVSGNQGTDFAAIGASVAGVAGDTVTANVGVTNNGPATLDRGRSGEPAVVAIITVPEGSKVVGLPKGCVKSDDDSLKTPKGKGRDQYACVSALVFPAKTTVTWPLKLQITSVVEDATGWIEVNPACECDIFSKDLNKDNDVAAIVLNPKGGTGPDGGPGGPGNQGGQGGGDGGGLPITGPQAGLFGGLGVLLVALGVGGVVLARRRRTRFDV